MPKTNAERQAAYRRRHLTGDGLRERLNLIVSLHTKRCLERLAACYGLPQRRILEHLLQEAEHMAIAALPHAAQRDYADKRPTPLRGHAPLSVFPEPEPDPELDERAP